VRLVWTPSLLNIDIDGNDYWIWEAIDAVRSGVVIIEYSSTFRPPYKVVEEHQPDRAEHRTFISGQA